MDKSKIVFLLVIVLLLALAAFAAVPEYEGFWTGTAELPGQVVDEITLVLVKTGTGYAGVISDTLGIIAPETSLAGVKIEGTVLIFHFPAVDGLTIASHLKAHGGRMAGTWADPDGGSGKIELTRKK